MRWDPRSRRIPRSRNFWEDQSRRRAAGVPGPHAEHV